ncbi:DNA polymerase [Polaromonas sp. YR568]|uniref:TIGR03915 family putative DNA repair protein n=1 Tax=Polaromonas sp. YR568 TaxID=1855301 RepID=UPI0008E2E971|nr:TIGR03915 family putative DNA repair protein [Polaromonas sp. YR568]SFU72095.1 DNA polymerase [Polaromonas sp. YR568]
MGVMNDLLTNDLFPQALLPVTLQGQADYEGFRRAARGMLAQNILPEQVSWQCSSTPFGGAEGAEATGPALSDAPAVSVPPEYVALCQLAVMHSSPQRFNLLYRLLWRLVHEPELRHNQLDADMALARQMAEEVRHDMQKMKAQLRFHSVQDDTFKSRPQGGPLHVAWFEPEHHIMDAVAPLFAKRFAHMRWAILTPEGSVEADYLGPQNFGHARHAGGAEYAVAKPQEPVVALRFGPAAGKSAAPTPDASEQRWLTFYEQVFHPDRLRRRLMQKEQPRHYRKSRPRAKPSSTGTRNTHAARGASGASGSGQASGRSLSI